MYESDFLKGVVEGDGSFGVTKPLPRLEVKKDYFWRIIAVMFFLLILCTLIYVAYLIQEKDILNMQFNSSSIDNNDYQIDLKPSINSPVNANIKNDYFNNHTIIVNVELSDEFLEAVRNGS